MGLVYFLLYLLFLLSGFIYHGGIVEAQEQHLKTGFFNKGGVLDVFSEGMVITTPPDYEYFPKKTFLGEDVVEGEIKEAENQSQNTKDKPLPMQADEIVEAYGDPSKEVPILAIDTAPKPYKGLMAALEAKDEKLAFQYAVQFVRHLRKFQNRNTKVMGLTGLALEHEGLLGKDGWQNSPYFQADRSLLEAEEAQDPSEELTSNLEINEEAQKLIDKILHKEDDGVGANASSKVNSPSAQKLDPKIERQKARQALWGKVPVDPQKKVEVYFFFRPRQTESQEMGSLVEGLYRFNGRNTNFSLVGATVDKITQSEEMAFRAGTGATYRISNGEELVEEFNLKKFPAVVLVAPTLNQAFVIQGQQNFYYLDEAVRVMGGR